MSNASNCNSASFDAADNRPFELEIGGSYGNSVLSLPSLFLRPHCRPRRLMYISRAVIPTVRSEADCERRVARCSSAPPPPPPSSSNPRPHKVALLLLPPRRRLLRPDSPRLSLLRIVLCSSPHPLHANGTAPPPTRRCLRACQADPSRDKSHATLPFLGEGRHGHVH
jgi:hypothetical protein